MTQTIEIQPEAIMVFSKGRVEFLVEVVEVLDGVCLVEDMRGRRFPVRTEVLREIREDDG